MNSYHETLLCLALRFALPKATAVHLYAKAVGVEPSREVIRRFNEAIKNKQLVDGLVLEKVEDRFILDTGDRQRYVTEMFLGECSPDWAKRLRTAMQEWK